MSDSVASLQPNTEYAVHLNGKTTIGSGASASTQLKVVAFRLDDSGKPIGAPIATVMGGNAFAQVGICTDQQRVEASTASAPWYRASFTHKKVDGEVVMANDAKGRPTDRPRKFWSVSL